MESIVFESVFAISPEGIRSQIKHKDYYYLKPGMEAKAVFNGSDISISGSQRCSYTLRITGETDLYSFWRCEGAFPLLYRLIDDSLCVEGTHHSPYCLEFDSHGESYPMAAYYKVTPSGTAAPWYNMGENDGECLKLGIWFKKDKVKILPGGSLRFIAEVYLKKDGKHPFDLGREPDAVYNIDLGEGSDNWREEFLQIDISREIGCILVYAKAEHITGTIRLEDPYLLTDNGYNLLPPFCPANPARQGYNWLGCNLSKKEWPEFEIKLNGKQIVEGGFFQRIYRWPVASLELPNDLIKKGKNELSIKLVSKCREALPYKLKKLEIVASPHGEMEIIAWPDLVEVGKEFAVLVKTGKDNIKAVICSSDKNIVPLKNEIVFGKEGLYNIGFKCIGYCSDISLVIHAGVERAIRIVRAVEKQEDGIITGTGDAVYINQNQKEMEKFLCWYLHHRIGSFITFRPVYRWSGTRVLNKGLWEWVSDFCSSMRLYYCHMIDGRELPGCNANPPGELMEGPYFLGRQSHEQDGAFYYWGHRRVSAADELYFDLWGKLGDPGGILPVTCPVRTNSGTYSYLNPEAAKDMAEAAGNFIKNIGYISEFASRHTGPSVLFKYIYQAGVEWLGAELMYGPHEVILAALRGASAAYGRESFGAHLAVQWSTVPHDSEGRYGRYFLALYLCYMHGVRHINTEEGLWRLEEGLADIERFDSAAVKHREIQQGFNHFVKSHSRRGDIHIPFAFIHGRYDGWSGFCITQNQVWMQDGDEWKAGHPEESWELLKIFYPRSVLDAIYKFPCPDSPQGYYTGTPYGPVDILPIEADGKVLGKYKTISFLGWNTADSSQIAKLIEFVRDGGTLLLGLPHLYTCTKRSEAFGPDSGVLNDSTTCELIGAFFEGYATARTKDDIPVTGGRITLAGAIPLETGKDDFPLVIENHLGEGRVIFINVKAYPSENCVRGIYSRLLNRLGGDINALERGSGWIQGNENVGFTVYDRITEGIRVIYIVNVDWWSKDDVPSRVKLLWGDSDFRLDIFRGKINILTLSNQWAIWTKDDDTDIIEIVENDGTALVKLQGMGKTSLTLFNKSLLSSSCNLKVCKDGEIIEAESDGRGINSWTVSLYLNGPAALKMQIQNLD